MAELTLDVARKILDVALAKGVEKKLKPLVVTVLDARGCVKISAAQDGTSLMRSEIAHGKAYGALAMGMGSRALFQRAQEQAYFVSAVNTMAQGRLIPVPGGVLIQDGGVLLGAVGVSGDTSDNDEICADRRHRGRRIEGQRGITDRRGSPAASPLPSPKCKLMSRPKNVLWIMCDQLRYDYLGCTGHPTLKTPNIDAMAKRGVRFSNAYVQSPICGPSRMSFYTGRYMRSHGSHWNGWPLRVGEPTLGDHLNKIGVRNVLVGKTHMAPDLEGLKMLGIAPDSIIGVHVAECGFEPYERDDGLHPTGRPRPKYDAYLRERGYDATNPWEHWANSGADEDGTLAERLAAGARRQGRPRGGRGFRDALHDAARDGFHHRGRSRRPALVHASVLHQAALALHRAGALCQHVRPGDVLPAVRSEQEKQSRIRYSPPIWTCATPATCRATRRGKKSFRPIWA